MWPSRVKRFTNVTHVHCPIIWTKVLGRVTFPSRSRFGRSWYLLYCLLWLKLHECGLPYHSDQGLWSCHMPRFHVLGKSGYLPYCPFVIEDHECDSRGLPYRDKRLTMWLTWIAVGHGTHPSIHSYHIVCPGVSSPFEIHTYSNQHLKICNRAIGATTTFVAPPRFRHFSTRYRHHIACLGVSSWDKMLSTKTAGYCLSCAYPFGIRLCIIHGKLLDICLSSFLFFVFISA